VYRLLKQTELDELIKHRNIINYVTTQRLSWFGQINRMPETSIVKKIYKWKPFTRRPVGKPKSRWDIRCQELPEKEENYKMDRTSPSSP
jgi:hypothetical protein